MRIWSRATAGGGGDGGGHGERGDAGVGHGFHDDSPFKSVWTLDAGGSRILFRSTASSWAMSRGHHRSRSQPFYDLPMTGV